MLVGERLIVNDILLILAYQYYLFAWRSICKILTDSNDVIRMTVLFVMVN